MTVIASPYDAAPREVRGHWDLVNCIGALLPGALPLALAGDAGDPVQVHVWKSPMTGDLLVERDGKLLLPGELPREVLALASSRYTLLPEVLPRRGLIDLPDAVWLSPDIATVHGLYEMIDRGSAGALAGSWWEPEDALGVPAPDSEFDRGAPGRGLPYRIYPTVARHDVVTVWGKARLTYALGLMWPGSTVLVGEGALVYREPQQGRYFVGNFQEARFGQIVPAESERPRGANDEDERRTLVIDSWGPEWWSAREGDWSSSTAVVARRVHRVIGDMGEWMSPYRPDDGIPGEG